MMSQSIMLGQIREVDGTKAVVAVNEMFEASLAIPVDEDEDYILGQPGSIVTINVSPNTKVVAIISGMKMVEVMKKDEHGTVYPVEQIRLEIHFVGQVSSNVFRRGVGIFPVIGSYVYAPTVQELSLMFSEFSTYDFSLGHLSTNKKQKCYINVDTFFGKHAAIIGTTGTGKSSAVASILQKASNSEKYPHAHIVILDLHNEYKSAFPKANHLSVENLKLPYWIMTFTELREVFTDKSEYSAHNQLRFFRDTVRTLKQMTLRENISAISTLIGREDAIRLLEDRLTVDTPVFFDIHELLRRADYEDEKLTKSQQYLQKFIQRVKSKLEDKRLDFLTNLTGVNNSIALPQIIEKILNSEKSVTVIDLSGIPSDVIGVVVSVIARTIFSFNLWNPMRSQYPICIVCEEAHTYLMQTTSSETKAATEQLEKIAKEGRKYGVGLIVVSQRPTELSTAVLSQCNTFITLRLTNQSDQTFVKKLVPDAISNMLDSLPTLHKGEALIIGEAIGMPCRAVMDRPYPEPSSHDVRFHEYWRVGSEDYRMQHVVQKWWLQEKN